MNILLKRFVAFSKVFVTFIAKYVIKMEKVPNFQQMFSSIIELGWYFSFGKNQNISIELLRKKVTTQEKR